MPRTRVHVDFNDVEEDGRIGALAESADDPSALVPGAEVTLWDEDGNTAQGRVVELADRGLVWIDPLRATWRSHLETSHHPANDLAITAAIGPINTVATTGSMFLSTAGTVSVNFLTPMTYFTFGGYLSIPTMGPFAAAGHPRPTFEDYYKVHCVTGVAPAAADVAA